MQVHSNCGALHSFYKTANKHTQRTKKLSSFIFITSYESVQIFWRPPKFTQPASEPFISNCTIWKWLKPSHQTTCMHAFYSSHIIYCPCLPGFSMLSYSSNWPTTELKKAVLRSSYHRTSKSNYAFWLLSFLYSCSLFYLKQSWLYMLCGSLGFSWFISCKVYLRSCRARQTESNCREPKSFFLNCHLEHESKCFAKNSCQF